MAIAMRQADLATKPSHLDLVPEIVARIVEEYHPRYVVLFGSVARGDETEHSDIDLFVIRDVEGSRIEAIRYPGEYRADRPHVELWSANERTYGASSHIPGSFCYGPAAEGRVVYAREGTRDLQIVRKEVTLNEIESRKAQDIATFLTLAKNDIRSARTHVGLPDFNNAVYHAQQCAEKSLKALLIQVGVAPERTHNVVQLADALPPDLQGRFDRDALGNLVDPVKRNETLVNVRYVADIPELTTSVVNTVIDQASEILDTCEWEIGRLARQTEADLDPEINL
ncbi:MAG: HEPN domain-containing protein [Acidimicrobiales bacterium]